MSPCGSWKQTNRPDLRVKVPNLRAPTAIPCSMSSVWYFWRAAIACEREIGDLQGGRLNFATKCDIS